MRQVDIVPDSPIEQLTRQFYDWERRGRGWTVWPGPVELEPPFVPLRFVLGPTVAAGFDDGRRPNLLARLFGPKTTHKEAWEEKPGNLEAMPGPDEPDSPLVELAVAAPPELSIGLEATEQMLLGLPESLAPVAFEILASPDRITLQAASRGPTVDLRGWLSAHAPDLVLTESGGALKSLWRGARGGATLVLEFGLSEEFMLPLRLPRSLEIDPLLGVYAALSSLRADEAAVVQALFRPARRAWAETVRPVLEGPDGDGFFLDAPELSTLAKQKFGRPLLAVVLRVAARSRSKERTLAVVHGVADALRSFRSPGGNAFIPLSNDEYPDPEHERDLLARRTRRSGMLLSATELATLVHLPSPAVRIEKLVRSARKTREAPAITAGHRLVLGMNAHAGEARQVALSADQRSRHMHVIGASGTGKSTLLLRMILQDLEQGNGVGVLDPHGDLVDAVLDRLPENRLDDLVLLDPADSEYAVAFNILSAHSELEKTLLSSDLVAVFRRLSETWGDQMNAVFANAILAFLESYRGGTLLDLRRFLVDPAFRADFLTTVADPACAYYWRKEFPLIRGNPQTPILTRLDAFLRPKLIRHMVGQRENRLDLRAVMDQGKVLLAKLAQGAIGEESAALLGTLLVGRIHETAMSRQDVSGASRRLFVLYIDEFQNFVTPTMAQILSGARKYGLALVLAHQDLRQLAGRDADVHAAVLSNPYTRVCFRVGDQDAKVLEKGFASFEARDLMSLGTGQAVVRVERADFDFNLDTSPMAPADEGAARRRREEAIARCRGKYGTARAEIDAAQAEAHAETEAPRDQAAPAAPAASEKPRPAPHRSAAAAERPKDAQVAASSAQTLPAAPGPGRGGPQHKYLQELLKRWAESRDWRAEIEERILDGLGSVDVALRKGERSVACEIAVTTTPEHEIGNIQKCLAAGFEHVVVVSPEKKILAKLRQAAGDGVSEDDAGRVHFGIPEEAFATLESIDTETAQPATTVRGYKVKVRHKALADRESAAKRYMVSGVVARALKRMSRSMGHPTALS